MKIHKNDNVTVVAGNYKGKTGKVLKVFHAKHVIQGSSHEPGKVVKTSDEGILVETGEGQILLTEVQLENHKRMSSELFLRGHPLPTGMRLG